MASAIFRVTAGDSITQGPAISTKGLLPPKITWSFILTCRTKGLLSANPAVYPPPWTRHE